MNSAFRGLLITISLVLLFGCSTEVDEVQQDAPRSSIPEKLFIIGQDLDAVRGYVNSQCCEPADAATAYLSFYNLLIPELGWGGLGIDETGMPVDLEWSWGAGPVSAYKTGKELGFESLAIGLSITENDHSGGLDRLIAGEYDANIDQLARFASLFSGTIYLRIGYEFDGHWNQGYQDSERFILAWKRIVDRLRASAAENIVFVWQSAASIADDVLDGFHEDIYDWYPGDDYADWVGISWFSPPHLQAVGFENRQVYTPMQLTMEVIELARAQNKPLMIAEAAPMGFDMLNNQRSNYSPLLDGEAGQNTRQLTAEEIWQSYFQPLFDLMNDHKDVIRALAYINQNWDKQEMWGAPWEGGYWGDSRLQVNPEIQDRFNEAIQNWKATP